LSLRGDAAAVNRETGRPGTSAEPGIVFPAAEERHTPMQITLKGRKALVTGGSLGLGFAIAKEFAEAGADVAIMARRRGPLDEAAAAIEVAPGQQVLPIVCDVARADDVKRGYGEVAAAFGKIDILVNNAGMSNAAPFEEVTDARWQEDFDLKLFAAIRLTRLAWPQMKQQRWGRIINVLNTGAKAPRPASAPTSVTRAAGMALTKVLSGEGAAHGILVNAMLVGLIESDQWVRRAQATGVPLRDVLANMGKDIPLGRVGTAQEFANLACFLASDAASYITGTAINVDGGRSPVP
jgi:NAD(P)-dependent dehydrogenase (short-subunit alcohol dehydrogenase family)